MKAFGRADAPYLFVMVSKPSEGMEAWFWRQLYKAGIRKTDCRIVYLINEPPAGTGNKPLVSQIKAAQERFQRDIKRSSPQIVVPMGTQPFYALTGINESVMDARGYLIRRKYFHPVPTRVWKEVGKYKNNSKATGAKKGDPKMKWVTEAHPTLLGEDWDGIVIPTFTLEHVRSEGFAVAPAFIEDIKRVERAGTGKLQEVGESLEYHTSLDTLPDPKTLGKLIAIDIETHGMDNEVIDLVSFSDGETTAVLDWTEGARLYIQKIFRLKNRIYLIHNSQFDIPRLVWNGVEIPQEVIDKQVFCTMFGAVQVQPDLHKALGRVATLYIDLEPWKTSSRKKGSHWRAMVAADPKAYAAKDSFYTYWIGWSLITIMKDFGIWKYYMGRDGHPGPGVMATLPELAAMSHGGLRINKEAARKACHLLERRQLRYLKIWRRLFPNVPFSKNQQVAKLLYNKWGLPLQRNKEDGVSVDELALVTLQAYVRDNKDDPDVQGKWQTDKRATPRVFDLMLKMRDVDKTLSTYVRPALLGDHWIKPSYLPVSKDDEGRRGGKKLDNKGTTATGRLASYKPNIQNQPKECRHGCKGPCGHFRVRNLYVPDTDKQCFVQADYKSAELYVLAGMSGDRRLLRDLKGDMHQLNADRLGVSRKVAKNVTYASQYLASPAKQSSMILEQEHMYVSSDDCKMISDGIWGYYTDATAYKDLLVSQCSQQGYIVNPFGRVRFFHSGRAPAAVDFIPQSTVADILWCVLKPVAEMARLYGGRLVTTVHDSILISVPKKYRKKAARHMKKIMEQRFDCVHPGFYIPVEIEMGDPGTPWGELQKWEAA